MTISPALATSIVDLSSLAPSLLAPDISAA
jgi:hypothetical protein